MQTWWFSGHTQTVASLLCSFASPPPLLSSPPSSPPPPFHKTTQASSEARRRKSKIYKRNTGDQWCCCILVNSTPLTGNQRSGHRSQCLLGSEVPVCMCVCLLGCVFARMHVFVHANICLCTHVCAGACVCISLGVHEAPPANVMGRDGKVTRNFVAN